MAKIRTRTGKRQFVQLYRNVKRSAAYHNLSCGARAALIELIDRYNGINNGFIALGCRELAYELGCSQATAMRTLRELDDAGLARPTKVGAWRGKKATEWRLTWRLCNKTGELPLNNWEQRPPYREFQIGSAKVSNRKHREVLRFKSEAHRPKNPMNGSGLSFKSEAHVHMYQGDSDTTARTEKARRHAGLPPLGAGSLPEAGAAPRRNGRGS